MYWVRVSFLSHVLVACQSESLDRRRGAAQRSRAAAEKAKYAPPRARAQVSGVPRTRARLSFACVRACVCLRPGSDCSVLCLCATCSTCAMLVAVGSGVIHAWCVAGRSRTRTGWGSWTWSQPRRCAPSSVGTPARLHAVLRVQLCLRLWVWRLR
jgi:hypothetical protein